MSPEETLSQLKSTSAIRTHKTLDAIYEVCKEQVERGMADFSYSTISRLGSGRGVPKAQSIRNKTGEHYRILIQSFSECFASVAQKNKPRAANAWIEDIKDPTLRFLVQMQAAELAESRRIVKELLPPGLEIKIDDRRSPNIEHKLDDVQRRALEYLGSDDFLRQWKFSVGKYGDVVDLNGEKIFKPGTLDGLKKALKFL